MNETIFISLPKSEFQNIIIDCVTACLKHNSITPSSEQQRDQWFDLDGFCNYLPEKPAKATVYNWVSKGDVPHHKKSKRLFFLKSEIDLWLKQYRKKTTSEIEAEADNYLSSQKRKTSRV